MIVRFPIDRRPHRARPVPRCWRMTASEYAALREDACLAALRPWSRLAAKMVRRSWRRPFLFRSRLIARRERLRRLAEEARRRKQAAVSTADRIDQIFLQQWEAEVAAAYGRTAARFGLPPRHTEPAPAVSYTWGPAWAGSP